MFDLTTIIYILAIIGILLILIIIKKESRYINENNRDEKYLDALYNIINHSISITKHLYVCNRNIEANKYLNEIKHSIKVLLEKNYLDFNKKIKLKELILELKNLLLSLNSFKQNESKLINELLTLINKDEN
jgi:uncharacterized protein (UPF0305 family)